MYKMKKMGSDVIKCDLCHLPITGEYIKSESNNYHNSCYEKSIKCELCKLPITCEYLAINEMNYHKKCFDKSLKCDLCHLPIIGSYKRFEEYNFHPKCANKSDKCLVCGVPIIGEYVQSGFKKFHKDCFAKADKCGICKFPIYGTYLKFKDKLLFHENCYANSKKCVICNLPILHGGKMLDEKNEKYICNECYEVSPKCAGCRAPIIDVYFSYGDTKEMFCYNCETKREHCDVCGHPVIDIYWELSDGRMVCEDCHKTAIMSQSEANDILMTVSKLIKQMFSMYVNHASELHLVDRNTIEKISGGLSHKTLGVFKSIGDDFDIYLEYGLPKSVTTGVLAHEYAHAWQSENCPHNQSKLVVEGFAMWVEYRILERLSYSKEMKQIKKRNDIYGNGFQKIKEYERRYGRNTLFNYVKEMV